MKHKASIITCSLMLFANVCLANEAETQRLITSLMYKSGLVSQIESNAETMVNEYVKALKTQGMPDAKVERVARGIAPFFNATSTKGEVRQYFVDNLSVDDIKEVMTWLESPLGKKVTQYEEETSDPRVFATIATESEPLKSNTVRVNKLKEHDELIKVVEGSTRMAINSQISLLLVISSTLPKDQRTGVESVKAEMQKNEPAIREIVASQLLSYQLVAYKNITDAELDRYLVFLDTESAKKYHKVTIDALDQSLVNANKRLGLSLAEKATRKK